MLTSGTGKVFDADSALAAESNAAVETIVKPTATFATTVVRTVDVVAAATPSDALPAAGSAPQSPAETQSSSILHVAGRRHLHAHRDGLAHDTI